ncbi:MAG: hypothetical protein ACQEQL_06860 [Pseudomonadota bacterium]
MSIALFSFSVLISAFIAGSVMMARRRDASLTAQTVPVDRK